LCLFFAADAGFIPPLPGGISLVFPGSCLAALSDWAKLETAPPPRLAVASGFVFAFGGLRILLPLCPIMFSSMEWCLIAE
jgi:hypothetical protein